MSQYRRFLGKRMLKGLTPAILILGFLLVGLFVFAHRAAAQGNESITVELTAQPKIGVINETEVEVTITLHGNTAACPVTPSQKAVDAVLLIDTSTSMNDEGGAKISNAKDAALIFIDSLTLTTPPNKGGDQIGLVIFSDYGQELSPLGQDRTKLKDLIRAIPPSGGTNIDEGIRQATKTVTDPAYQNPEAVRVIVLLTDGQSDKDLAVQAADQAKAAGIRVVTIGVGSDVEPDTLRAVASSPSDYFEAPKPADLPTIYKRIANEIQPTVAGTDIDLNFKINSSLFELVPNSFSVPPVSVTGDTIHWTYGHVDNSDTPTFSFRVRPLHAGPGNVGDLVNSSYLVCEDTTQRKPLSASGPQLVGLLPSPTPSFTPTNTPLPSPTPSNTPTPTQPGAITNKTVINNTKGTSLFTALQFCANELVLLIPLILILLAAFSIWTLVGWRNRKDCSLWCFLTWTGFGGWGALALGLTLLPPIANYCPPRESVYFWRMDTTKRVTGIYLAAVDVNSAAAFSQMNVNGCVGCHTVSSSSNRVAAILGSPPSRLGVFNFDGSRVTTIPPNLEINFAAFSPDGQSMVIADKDAMLSILDLKTGAVTPLQGAHDPNVVQTMPAWSKNGQIAFVRTADRSAMAYGGFIINGPTDIYTVPATGGVAKPVEGASGSGFNYYPAFSPDSRWLAFTKHNDKTTYADPEAEIWIVSAQGGKASRLRANDDADGSPIVSASNSWPSWSLDGKQLAFNSKRGDPTSFDIYTTTIDDDGNSGPAIPLPAGSEPGTFEHNPFWGTPANRIDAVAQMLALWPWWLPLIPLALLHLAACRTQIVEPKPPSPPPVIGELAPPPLETLKLPSFPILWQPQPTLIIGLGNTGRWVLTHLKKNLRDADPAQMSTQKDQVALLCLDTGDYKLLQGQDAAISFAGISLDADQVIELKGNLANQLNKIDFENDPQFREWLNKPKIDDMREASGLNLNKGAKGDRLLARAAFLLHLQQENNFFQRLSRIIPDCLSDNNLDVVLVSDSVGDVSSAVLFDIALLVRQAATNAGAEGVFITAHVVTDGAFSPFAKTRDRGRDLVNTGAFLREVNRFQLAGARPFPVFYGDLIPAGECHDLAINNLILYDGKGLSYTGQQNKPEWGIFPVVADSVAMWMDTVARQGELKTLQDQQHRQIINQQKNNAQVYCFSQGGYTYRLPFADLIEDVRFRFGGEVLRRLFSGRSSDDASLKPELNKEFFLPGDNTPVGVARAFLTGTISIPSKPAVDKSVFAALYVLVENRPHYFAPAFRSMATTNLTDSLSARFNQALAILLNGSAKTEETDVFTARGGKIGFALAFLDSLTTEITQVISRLGQGEEGSGNRKRLDEALNELDKLVLGSKTSLQNQANALKAMLDGEDALLVRIGTQFETSHEEKAPLTRSYIWNDKDGNPLGKVWYEKYLGEKKDRPNEDPRSRALKGLVWQIENGIVTLGINLTQTDEQGNEVEVLRETLDPDHPGAFEKVFMDMVRLFCREIYVKETLESLLTSDLLSEDKIASTARTLLDHSNPLLAVDNTQGEEYKLSYILAANETVDISKLRGLIRLPPGAELLPMQTTDPYVLSLSQRYALVPFKALVSLETANKSYRDNYGLSTGVKRPAAPIQTAVFEAEAVALTLESQMVEVLHTDATLLDPLVVTALTNSRRARTYLLALAADEIRLVNVPGKVAKSLEYRAPQNRKPFKDIEGSSLHPYVEGLLKFVLDTKTFDDAFVTQMLERYDHPDEDMKTDFELWVRPGKRGVRSQAEAKLDELEKENDLIKRAMTDMLKVSRLYVELVLRSLSSD